MISTVRKSFRPRRAVAAGIFAGALLLLPARAEILSLDHGTVKVGIDDAKGAAIHFRSWLVVGNKTEITARLEALWKIYSGARAHLTNSFNPFSKPATTSSHSTQ